MRKFFSRLWRILTAPFRFIAWLVGLVVRAVKNVYTRYKIFWEDDSEAQARPTGDVVGELTENPMSGLEAVLAHIFDFREHILRIVIALFGATLLSLIFARYTLEFLAQPIGGLQNVQAIEVTETIGVYMRIGLLVGFTAALPYILLELLLFIAPALAPRDRRMALGSIPMVTALFILGMAFAFFFLLQPALDFLVDFMDIPTRIRPASYFPFVTNLMFWIGVAFEFPILIYFLSVVGLLTKELLLRYARVSMVLLAVLAAAITPTVDPVNMMLLWVPLVGLYFLGVGFAALGERVRRRRLRPA